MRISRRGKGVKKSTKSHSQDIFDFVDFVHCGRPAPAPLPRAPPRGTSRRARVSSTECGPHRAQLHTAHTQRACPVVRAAADVGGRCGRGGRRWRSGPAPARSAGPAPGVGIPSYARRILIVTNRTTELYSPTRYRVKPYFVISCSATRTTHARVLPSTSSIFLLPFTATFHQSWAQLALSGTCGRLQTYHDADAGRPAAQL